MATENRINKSGIASPTEKTNLSERVDNGPYIGIVKGYSDPTGKGRIAVYIPSLQTTRLSSETGPNKEEKSENIILCNIMSPYYGRTNRTGNNQSSYAGTSKSYGMAVPTPDIDTQVVVMFMDSKKHNGLIIGYAPDPFTTHMIPGIASNPAFHPNDSSKCAGLSPVATRVPVAEFNRQTIDEREDWLNIPRPVHPLLDVLLEQGLAEDEERGTTTSSINRDYPNGILGFSTPGPLDTEGPKITQGLKSSGNSDGYETYEWPASRGIGHTFVLDDGTETGGSRHIRLRSGTGHQVLLNDTEGVIYIGNSTGSAWMEFTNDGRIEFFGDSDFALHAKGNIHMLSDKNINIQAGEDINVLAGHNMRIETNPTGVPGKGDFHQYINGDVHVTSTGDTHFKNTIGKFNVTALRDISLTTRACMFLKSGGAAFPIHLNGPTGTLAKIAAHVPQYTSPSTEFNDARCTWEVSATHEYVAATARVPVRQPEPRERIATTDTDGDPEHLRPIPK
jgi:hypothetical protein